MRPPLTQCRMWCRSVRRDSHPGNRHRPWSRSRAARRIAELGRRRRRPRASTAPASPWVIQDSAAVQVTICAVDTLMAGPSSHVAAGRIRRVTRDPRRGRGRFRGNARVRGRDRRPGEHIGAGVDYDLVDLRVIGPGDLPGQERLRHRDQPVSQVRRRPDRRGRSCGRRARGGRRLHGCRRFRGGRRFRGNAGGRITGQVGAGSPQRLQQHRPGQRRQPERARQRPVLLEPPGQPAPHPGLRVIRPG